MPKQINTPTFGSQLVRLFNLKGRFTPVLDEVIVPVVVVGTSSPAQERHFGGTAELGSTGATIKYHNLSNPAGSNVLLKLISVAVGQTANAFWDFSVAGSGAAMVNAATVATRELDGERRNVFAASGTRALLTAEETPPVIVVSRIARWNFVIQTAALSAYGFNTPLDLRGVTLIPGQSFSASGGSMNATTTTAWRWIELPLVSKSSIGI